MKVVQINATCGVGSTGKICVGISKIMTENNIENYILFSNRSNGYPLGIQCSTDRYIKIQAVKSRILGNYGFNSKKATRNIIKELERINPDIIHLHNIHGHDCDLEMLFRYFKNKKIKLVWTFHDCWAFTGYCTHFTMSGCDKWQNGCNGCIQKYDYSLFSDKSKIIHNKKMKLFADLDMTIVTPSRWLSEIVSGSFLKNYPVTVINNGINLSVFKCTESDFRKKYNLENKKVILGVALGWGKRKGLDVFVELAKKLPDEYRIVLVGTDENVEKQFPDNIISIYKTKNQQELAEIYSAADVFVNPTREDNYPTVNMEAIACGTPVITFKTGGSPEMIDETCGFVVECDDIDALKKEIIRICIENLFTAENCKNKSKEFDENERYKEYVELYERIIAAGNEEN